MRGFREAAGHYRNRLVSPDTQIMIHLLAATQGAIKLTELAEATGLSNPVVLRVVDSLLARQLVKPVGDVPAEPWQASVAIDEESHCVIGINVLAHRLLGVVANLRAQPIRRDEFNLTATDPDTVVHGIVELVERLRSYTAVIPFRTSSASASRSPVMSTAGRAGCSPHRIWAGPPWSICSSEVEERTGLVTVIENDANAQAIYEQLYGECGFEDTFVVVLLAEHGIGAGVVVDHQLVHGATGAAGEIGHLGIGNALEPCQCGRQGCLEATAGVAAIIRRTNEARPGQSPISTLREACEGDRPRRPGRVLLGGRGGRSGPFPGLVAARPDRVVVHVPRFLDTEAEGSFSSAAAAFQRALERSARQYSFSSTFEDCKILVKHMEHGKLHGAIGAAAAVLAGLVQDPANEQYYRSASPSFAEDGCLRTGTRIVDRISGLAGQMIYLNGESAMLDNLRDEVVEPCLHHGSTAKRLNGSWPLYRRSPGRRGAPARPAPRAARPACRWPACHRRRACAGATKATPGAHLTVAVSTVGELIPVASSTRACPTRALLTHNVTDSAAVAPGWADPTSDSS